VPARGQTGFKETKVEDLTALNEFVRYLKPPEVSGRGSRKGSNLPD